MEQTIAGKIGRYEILKALGREVFLAKDEKLGRRVAIRHPRNLAIGKGVARLQAEASAAALRHSSIPTVYEIGTHDGLPFIAMEYVEGDTLQTIIERKRKLDLLTMLRVMEQVCSALGYAHRNGIVHRDIRAGNVIVNSDGTAKIVGFGTATRKEDEHRSDAADAQQQAERRADLFCTGVMLLQLFTGGKPSSSSEVTGLFETVSDAEAAFGKHLREYPPSLVRIVAKSLMGNADHRYQTGEEFAEALQGVIAELKRTRVTELLSRAERLIAQHRWAPALELLDQAVKLDASYAPARKLRKAAREQQEKIRRAERVEECILKSDEAVRCGNFEEALIQLRDAQTLDADSQEIRGKLEAVKKQKIRAESSALAMVQAERIRDAGDVQGALRILTKALQEDPGNGDLVSLIDELHEHVDMEARRGRLSELQSMSARAIAIGDYDRADLLLTEAEGIDPEDAQTHHLRSQLRQARDLEEREWLLEQIQARIAQLIRTDSYDEASDLVGKMLECMPSEPFLHRLRAEAEAAARQYDVRRIVDLAIDEVTELSAMSLSQAMSVLETAIEKMPGEERLMELERTLRRRLEEPSTEQVRA